LLLFVVVLLLLLLLFVGHFSLVVVDLHKAVTTTASGGLRQSHLVRACL